MNIDLSKVKLTESLPLTSRDQHFFADLTRFMNAESAQVGDKPSKERFAIFRLAFEKVTLLALSRCARSCRLIVFEDHRHFITLPSSVPSNQTRIRAMQGCIARILV